MNATNKTAENVDMKIHFVFGEHLITYGYNLQ